MTNDERDELQYWISLGNDRGHASMFASDNKPGTREIVEASAVSEWAKSMEACYGVEVSKVEVNPNDPPDCYAQVNRVRIGVEVTELIDGELLAEIKRTQRTTHNDFNLFQRSQWTWERLSKQIDLLLDKKAGNYGRRGIVVDVLLICTDENWLLPNDVEDWLKRSFFSKRDNVENAFLLMSYDPAYSARHGGCWPLFHLYGPMTLEAKEVP